MNLIVDGKSIDAVEMCSQCGKPSPWVSKEFRLCKACMKERHASEDALKIEVRRRFNLNRSPDLRSCFLKLLLFDEVNLEPSGWRTGLALGCELKASGFRSQEAEQVLIQASGQDEKARRLMEIVYGNYKRSTSVWTCGQLRGLEIVCSECPQQFRVELKESITEIYSSSPRQVTAGG